MQFFNVHISQKAIDLVVKTLETGWISEGAGVRAFEDALASQLGLVNPVALNSGTSALHLALAIAGVGPGDEVILPAQTFVASGLAVLFQGAVPVFADIDPRTGNISPAAAAKKVGPRTKAIMAVHWGGYPCDLDELNTIARKHDLCVIEDAAHALGARYRDRPIGAISRFTCFSFQAIKHLTTGDGGALCCLRGDDAHSAVVRRWFGINRLNSGPSILGEREYDIDQVGYKYHMNDIAAAIGLGNMEGIEQRLERRRDIAAAYRSGLTGIPGMELLRTENDRVPANWLFTVLVENREGFVRKLLSAAVPASVVHLSIDRNSIFSGQQADLPGQLEFNARQISIPLHDGLTDKDVEQVIRCIREGW